MADATTQTLPSMFFDMAAVKGKKTVYAAMEDGKWKKISWKDGAKIATDLAKGLKHLGVEAGDRVVLCSENRPEWCLANIGIMASGAISVPAYITNTTSDHNHILTDSGAVGAIVSTRALAKQLLPAAIEAPNCRFVICIEPILVQQATTTDVHAWDAVVAAGAEQKSIRVDEIVAGLDRNETACLIYTSGTGGTPKGVMLSHRAIIANVIGARAVLEDGWSIKDDTFLSFLPLSHAYEHMAGMWLPIQIGADVYFAESIEKLTDNMAATRPTIMTAVPRLFEAVRMKVIRGLKSQSEAKQKLFWRAVDLGTKKFHGEELSFREKIEDAVLERLVRSKVRARFGGRLKAFVSGGAALNYEIAVFFEALGVTIIQGYGQTEAAPLISVNRRYPNKVKTVGPAVVGCEMQIAPDGEVICRGDNLMNGYWGRDEATAETIVDGWLHTGDIGELDADGYLTITDRKKDIIVNSGGDNISPARVEGFLTLETEIGQAMVYGDKKPYLTAIIVPDPEYLVDFCKANGVKNNLASLTDNDQLKTEIKAAIDKVNGKLANLEKVRKFMISPIEFSTDNGLMTPSLKVKRHLVKKEYGEQLERLYDRGGAVEKKAA